MFLFSFGIFAGMLSFPGYFPAARLSMALLNSSKTGSEPPWSSG